MSTLKTQQNIRRNFCFHVERSRPPLQLLKILCGPNQTFLWVIFMLTMLFKSPSCLVFLSCRLIFSTSLYVTRSEAQDKAWHRGAFPLLWQNISRTDAYLNIKLHKYLFYFVSLVSLAAWITHYCWTVFAVCLLVISLQRRHLSNSQSI